MPRSQPSEVELAAEADHRPDQQLHAACEEAPGTEPTSAAGADVVRLPALADDYITAYPRRNPGQHLRLTRATFQRTLLHIPRG